MIKDRILSKNVDFTRVRKDDFSLNIKISKIRNKETELSKVYNIKKYLNPNQYAFPQEPQTIQSPQPEAKPEPQTIQPPQPEAKPEPQTETSLPEAKPEPQTIQPPQPEAKPEPQTETSQPEASNSPSEMNLENKTTEELRTLYEKLSNDYQTNPSDNVRNELEKIQNIMQKSSQKDMAAKPAEM